MEDNMEIETSADAALENSGVAALVVNHIPENPAADLDSFNNLYDMSGKKILIIFNQHTFQKTKYFHNRQYSPRNGTEKDVERLYKTFGDLGFKVDAYNDLTYDDIKDRMYELCKEDHSNTSCVAIAILTHGDVGGEVCATDRSYSVSEIITDLQMTPGFAGKPKLIFVQACRGKKIDSGHHIQLDGVEAAEVIPTRADCLVLFSSCDEYYSFRDSNGSWMIKALCNVISKYYDELEILHLMTLVLRQVAQESTYIPSDLTIHNKKQMPELRSTMTKFLKFSK